MHDLTATKSLRSEHTEILWFWFIFFLATLARLFLSARLGLSDDEAYYWEWSRHLDWSYLDHPGMTAWLIALSEKLMPSSPLSVRMPGLILNTAAWYLLWRLTYNFFGSFAALVTGIFYVLIPLYGLGGLMMVPDVPMAFCWMGVLRLVSTRLLDKSKDQRLTWISIGCLMGLGFLSKYTMALLGFSLILFVAATPSLRHHLKTRWPWLAVGIFLIFCIPIVIWNSQNQWLSFLYQFVSRHQGEGLDFTRWLTFLLSQIGILTPVIFGLFCWAAFYAVKHAKNLQWRFIAFFSLPTLTVFTLQAAFAEFKMHWTGPGYVPLLMATGFLWEKVTAKTRRVLVTLSLLFLLPINGIFYTAVVTPIAPWIVDHLPSSWTASIPLQNPKWDPTNDLYGWPEAGARAQSLQAHYLRTTGKMPFLASYRYQLSSSLAFATKDKVWSLADVTEFYDFIQTESALAPLKGQNAIVVTDNKYDEIAQIEGRFASCKKLQNLEIKRKQRLARVFDFWLCQSYKGEPKIRAPWQQAS